MVVRIFETGFYKVETHLLCLILAQPRLNQKLILKTKGINAARVVYINFEFRKYTFRHEILKVFQRFIMNPAISLQFELSPVLALQFSGQDKPLNQKNFDRTKFATLRRL